MMNDHDRYFVLTLIVISTIIGAGSVSYSQDEIAVLVGTRGLIDGIHANYVKDLKAVWNATSFAMYDNGTITADLKFMYLSDNPTTSSIYNTTTHRTESIATNGDLKYLSSIAMMKVVGEYYDSQFGTGTSPSLSKLIPVTTLELDSQTSLASFRAGYNTSSEYFTPIPPNYELRSYWVVLSWVRVFEDDDGKRYYQWLVGTSPHACGNSPQCVKLNQEYHSLSGSLGVYMPIPEDATATLPESVTGTHKVGFDYVNWIAENTNDDGLISDGNNNPSGTEFESTERYDFVVVPLYLIIGIPMVIMGAIIGSIFGFRRWRRKSGR